MSLSRIKRVVWTAVKLFAVFTLLVGLAYPLAFVGIGKVFSDQAQGSLLVHDDGVKVSSGKERVVGSRLLAQPVTKPGYFYYRPSASETGADPQSSGASNLSPSSGELKDLISERRSVVAQREHVQPGVVPIDALTVSGSSLDPHISVSYAELQIARVARERGIDEKVIKQTVENNTEQVLNGLEESKVVNVTALNFALDEL